MPTAGSARSGLTPITPEDTRLLLHLDVETGRIESLYEFNAVEVAGDGQRVGSWFRGVARDAVNLLDRLLDGLVARAAAVVNPHEREARHFPRGDSTVVLDLQRAVAGVAVEPVSRQRIQRLLRRVVVRSGNGHSLVRLIARALDSVDLAESRLDRCRAREAAKVPPLQLNFRLGSRGRNRNEQGTQTGEQDRSKASHA